MASLGTKRNVLGGVYKAVASGSIANGKACNINSDGTVSQATSVDGKRIFLVFNAGGGICLLYTSPSPRDATLSRMPSSA